MLRFAFARPLGNLALFFSFALFNGCNLSHNFDFTLDNQSGIIYKTVQKDKAGK